MCHALLLGIYICSSRPIDRVVELRNGLSKKADVLEPPDPTMLRGVSFARGTPSAFDFGVAATYSESAVGYPLFKI